MWIVPGLLWRGVKPGLALALVGAEMRNWAFVETGDRVRLLRKTDKQPAGEVQQLLFVPDYIRHIPTHAIVFLAAGMQPHRAAAAMVKSHRRATVSVPCFVWVARGFAPFAVAQPGLHAHICNFSGATPAVLCKRVANLRPDGRFAAPVRPFGIDHPGAG